MRFTSSTTIYFHLKKSLPFTANIVLCSRYPAIVGIVVGSLVLLGILWCIIGCLCCGYTCCKGCCSCCCPSRSGKPGDKKRSKFADDHSSPFHPASAPPPPPPANFGYQPNPAPPAYNNAPPSYNNNNNNNTNQQPSYAQFDMTPRPSPSPGGGRGAPGSTQKVNEDALPAMPSWNDAHTRHVEDTSPNDMEMDRLDPATGQNVGTVGVAGVGAAAAGAGAGAGRSGKGGYYEVPSQPNSPSFAPPDAYRGTETTHGPLGPTPIGVAHGGEYNDYPHRRPSPSPYMDNTSYSHAYSGGNGMYAADNAHTPAPVPPRSPSSYYTSASPPPSVAPPPSYRTYSPAPAPISSPPPPSFHTYPGPQDQQQQQAARPPSLLQAGRKPVGNSWRDV